MSNDFYCDYVLSGETPVVTVAESARVLAFEHTAPTWEIHIVVIPKVHVQRLIDIDDPTLFSELFLVMRRIIQERGFAESNYKIITNGGSYQSTQHLHFHLVSGSPLNLLNPVQYGEMSV